MSEAGETAAIPAPERIRLEAPQLLERYNGIDPELAKRALEQAPAEREQAAAGKPWIGAAAFAGGFLLWHLLAGRR